MKIELKVDWWKFDEISMKSQWIFDEKSMNFWWKVDEIWMKSRWNMDEKFMKYRWKVDEKAKNEQIDWIGVGIKRLPAFLG